METVQLLRPLGSIWVLAQEKRGLCDLFGSMMRVAEGRSSSTKLFSEFVSATGESLIKFWAEPRISEREFRRLLTTSEPSLFARGSVGYASDGGYLRVDTSLLREANPEQHVISTRSLRESPHELIPGTLVIEGVTGEDAVAWSQLSQERFSRQTVLGNIVGPRLSLELRHVGEPRVMRHVPEWEFFRSEAVREELIAGPFLEQVTLGASGALLVCGFVVGHSGTRLRVSTGVRVLELAVDAIEGPIEGSLRSALGPLASKFAVYFELVLHSSQVVGPLGEIPRTVVSDLNRRATEFLSRSIAREEFQSLLEGALEIQIEQQHRRLHGRKAAVHSARYVYLRRAHIRKRLFPEPRNEQEVVLLTSLLAREGVFPEFEFLDYSTQAGIDALASVRLTTRRARDEDALVEFKFRLENFLDERQPLSLVDVIVAWDCDLRKFERGAYRGYRYESAVENKPWLGRLVKEADGSTADVVLLKRIPELEVTWDNPKRRGHRDKSC